MGKERAKRKKRDKWNVPAASLTKTEGDGQPPPAYCIPERGGAESIRPCISRLPIPPCKSSETTLPRSILRVQNDPDANPELDPGSPSLKFELPKRNTMTRWQIETCMRPCTRLAPRLILPIHSFLPWPSSRLSTGHLSLSTKQKAAPVSC